jgi:hypothetical protein
MKVRIKNLVIAGLIMFSACKKNNDKDATNPPITNTQEQITTVLIKGYNEADPSDASKQFSLTWEDLDGVGGKVPSIDSLKLDTVIRYLAHVLLIDKTKTPWDTISAEVAEKKNIHQFFYTVTGSVQPYVSVQILDMDNNTPPLPVGLSIAILTQPTGNTTIPLTGGLRVVLSHYDGIPKTAIPSPESDIDITFPMRLQ